MPNLPDLIKNGDHEDSDVLFRMTRRHANILGAYLSGRNDIAPLPAPIRELLDALTMRLVGPPGSRRWADLRRAMDGQPVIDAADWMQSGGPARYAPERVYHRPRRPYDGGPNGEDLNEVLLGDADGTTLNEFLNAKPETD